MHMKKLNFVTELLLLCAGSVAITTGAASSGQVLAWGAAYSGQTTVPESPQNGVTAIATAGFHTVAFEERRQCRDVGRQQPRPNGCAWRRRAESRQLRRGVLTPWLYSAPARPG
jgi:hypothetical protein